MCLRIPGVFSNEFVCFSPPLLLSVLGPAFLGIFTTNCFLHLWNLIVGVTFFLFEFPFFSRILATIFLVNFMGFFHSERCALRKDSRMFRHLIYPFPTCVRTILPIDTYMCQFANFRLMSENSGFAAISFPKLIPN